MIEDNRDIIRPKTELEVMVENLKEMIEIPAKRDVDIERMNVQSNERISIKSLNYTFIILMSILGVGATFGIITFLKGDLDLSISIVRDIIIGGFAFLAGKSFGETRRN